MITATISTHDDVPQIVAVGDRRAPVPYDTEAPGAAISMTLNFLGYEIVGPFAKVDDATSTVPVQQTPDGFLRGLIEFARHQRGTYVTEVGGMPRVYLDTALFVRMAAGMTTMELRSYEEREDEVRIR